MMEKNENKTYCFDTLPFLRDVILFATSQALTPKQIIEKARQKQQDIQESVDCLFLSKTTETKVIQCTDDGSTHAIAINENSEIMDITFDLNAFLKYGEKAIVGDFKFEYSNFFFKIYKNDDPEPKKIYGNFSSPLKALVDYQLTAENFISSDFLGAIWRIEQGKMLGSMNIKEVNLKISFADKKYKFNILEIQDYEAIENILDEFFIAINGSILQKHLKTNKE